MDGRIVRCSTVHHANQLPLLRLQALLAMSPTYVSGAIAAMTTIVISILIFFLLPLPLYKAP